MRRIFTLLFWLLELPLVLLVALLLLFWFWSGSDESLASALNQARRYLPAGQTLVAEDVRGSLRQGGHIGLLRWQKNGLTLQARQIDLVWRPIALINRRLQLDSVHVAELSIDDQSPASSAAPLTEVVLPFEVDLVFGIDQLRLAGPPAMQAGALTGSYRFDGQQHSLQLTQARVAAGSYQAQARLQARAPMALDLQVQGKVQAPIGDQRSITLDAAGSVRGPLAGSNVVLDVLAQLQPGKTAPPVRSERPPSALPKRPPSVRPAPIEGPPSSTFSAMRASIVAKISPWAKQPVLSAQADFSQLNLALLWPDAPQTLLTGNARVRPQGDNWQGQVKLANALAGPWDKGRLPLDNAQAQVEYSAGRWAIQSLGAQGAGGRIEAQGQLADAASVGALSGWAGQATAQGVNPALVYSRLAPARLDGKLQARAQQQAIVFDASLQPAGQQPAASPLQGLRLRSASAKGQWAAGWLQLQSLNLQTDDAVAQGQLDLQPASQLVRGQLQLTLPGADAKISGQLGPQAGAGDLALAVTDAAQAARWLARLPQAPPVLAQTGLSGRADLALHWQGGWQAWLGAGAGAGDLTVQANLRVPQLDVRPAGPAAAQTLRLRDFSAELSGRLQALTLRASGELAQGTLRAQLEAQAQGGRGSSGEWQASVNPLRLQLQDSQRPGPWTLKLRQPLALAWQAAASGGALLASAGEAELSGPVPGAATLAWEPVRWSTGARNELLSKGQLRGLGLAWLEMLGNTQLANLGLNGNLVFDGDWDVAVTDTFKLRAALVRRSGDIRVQTESGTASSTITGTVATPTIAAGVKDARLTLLAEGDTLRATLLWDSERAGNAQADLRTRVTRGAQGWDWAADAPVDGSVKASLPQVGVWSVLAPPGWRMRGTLEANLGLTGTRAAPQWSGTLLADDLGLRSVVDGIEFGNGRLRASMRGQRLDITEFTLQGAGGAAGGELNAKGFALWLPDGSGANPALAKVRIELDASARALRVSSRADRRLVVSGTLQARLNNAKLDIRGALKADQALFILPDEAAPSLGDDVAIKGRTGATGGPAPGSPGGSTAATTPPASGADSAGTRVLTDVQVALDLGPDFRVQGRGINTRLAGTLQLRSSADANAAPRLTGEVRTVLGNYKAYGQQLDIETGVMRFLGAYDNPALDILAIRPNLTQRVGVQITGTVLAPRVRLFSEPELPQAEKLAWLVLGRSGANGGAESAVLQQAAFALLGRNGQGLSGGLANRLGLDELSFATGSTNADGSAGSATVTLGKRISRDFYVAYERSLAGTLGTFSIFYDLSKRFTLRARTGEQSAVDLIFTLSYD